MVANNTGAIMDRNFVKQIKTISKTLKEVSSDLNKQFKEKDKRKKIAVFNDKLKKILELCVSVKDNLSKDTSNQHDEFLKIVNVAEKLCSEFLVYTEELHKKVTNEQV